MFGVEIQIDPSDLKKLSEMDKKIVFSRPPSFEPEIDTSRWESWLVWGSVAPKPLVRINWEERYRVFASDNGPTPYREMDVNGCIITASDAYDRSINYVFTDYYTMESRPLTSAQGEKGNYYARNESGRSGVYFGLAQAVDFSASRSYNYLPIDAVPLACEDDVCFCPPPGLMIYINRDSRLRRARMAGVSSTPLFLSYEGVADGTALKVRYNGALNRFEQL